MNISDSRRRVFYHGEYGSRKKASKPNRIVIEERDAGRREKILPGDGGGKMISGGGLSNSLHKESRTFYWGRGGGGGVTGTEKP